MTINRIFATGTAALVGAALLIAVSTPAGASPPTRFEVCPAILSEPICDLVRLPEPDSSGSGTKPAVVPDVVRPATTRVDLSCGGTPILIVEACPV